MATLLEEHPWKEYIPPNCKFLVIGTFPTETKNRIFEFFYPSPRNLFWSVIAHLVPLKITHFKDQEAIEQRKAALDLLHMGVTDMGYKVQRNGDGSFDNILEAIEYMDIQNILIRNPSIKTIILTSSSGKQNAFKWFSHYSRVNNFKLEIEKKKLPFYGKFYFEKRELRIAVLPSTSPSASQGMDTLVSLYLHEIGLT